MLQTLFQQCPFGGRHRTQGVSRKGLGLGAVEIAGGIHQSQVTSPSRTPLAVYYTAPGAVAGTWPTVAPFPPAGVVLFQC